MANLFQKMLWAINPVKHARDAQSIRGTKTKFQIFRIDSSCPSLEVGIPIEWSRTPWNKCIRFAPPELHLVGNKQSAKIDILLRDCGEPDKNGNYIPQGRADDIKFAYKHLYDSFRSIDFHKVDIKGGETASYILFRYKSYNVDCIDSHTFIQKRHYNFTVICSSAVKYSGVYKDLYNAVHSTIGIK